MDVTTPWPPASSYIQLANTLISSKGLKVSRIDTLDEFTPYISLSIYDKLRQHSLPISWEYYRGKDLDRLYHRMLTELLTHATVRRMFKENTTADSLLNRSRESHLMALIESLFIVSTVGWSDRIDDIDDVECLKNPETEKKVNGKLRNDQCLRKSRQGCQRSRERRNVSTSDFLLFGEDVDADVLASSEIASLASVAADVTASEIYKGEYAERGRRSGTRRKQGHRSFDDGFSAWARMSHSEDQVKAAVKTGVREGAHSNRQRYHNKDIGDASSAVSVNRDDVSLGLDPTLDTTDTTVAKREYLLKKKNTRVPKKTQSYAYDIAQRTTKDADRLRSDMEFAQRLAAKVAEQSRKRAIRTELSTQRHLSAKMRRYYHDYATQHAAKMCRRNNEEEVLLTRLFKQCVSIQKQRIREEQRDEEARVKAREDAERDRLDSLENFYKDQLDMLKEQLHDQRSDLRIRNKANAQAARDTEKELKSRLQLDIKKLQDRLYNDNDTRHFRERDAQRLINDMIKYQR